MLARHTSSIARVTGLVSLVALVSFAGGCSVDVEDGELDDVESAEDAVSAARAIQPKMTSVRVLAAKSFAARPPARFRNDVVVAAPAGLDRTPREVRRATSRAFTWDGNSRVVLFGNAAGDAPIVADDFVLVEVLDAATGATLATRTIGAPFQVTVGSSAAVGAPAYDKGFEITQALPPGKAFRLRLSGLDVGGKASVTDVYLAARELPADPFAEGFCAGPRMTREQALRHIPPGAQWGREIPLTDSNVETRVRTCGPTGCGEWRNAIYTGDNAIEGDVTSFSQGYTWRTNVAFRQEDLRKNLHAKVEQDGFQLFSKRPYEVSISYPSTGRFAWMQGVVFFAGAPYGQGPSWAHMSSGGAVDGETELRVGNDCFQLRNFRKEQGKEILTVAYGRFAAP